MFNKFCCPKCGDMMFNMVDWETFIDETGVLKQKAFLQFTCCEIHNGPKVALGDDFDWLEWAEFEHFKQKLKSDFWQDFRDGLLGYD